MQIIWTDIQPVDDTKKMYEVKQFDYERPNTWAVEEQKRRERKKIIHKIVGDNYGKTFIDR